MAGKRYSKLTDRIIQTVCDFIDDGDETLPKRVFYDSQVPGLRIRVGRHRRTWFYFQEYRVKGKRGTVFRRLGFWPGMNVATARKEALQHAARVAAGRPQPGRRDAITLEQATTEYIESLKARGKKSARHVRSLTSIHLLPEFGRFTLAELSDAPALVRDHHLKISKRSPVSANRVMTMLGSIYRHAARLDRSLPQASPISAVRFNREEPAQTAMSFSEFPVWRERVETLPPIRTAYFRFLLLTGMRGGEATRLRWSDIDTRTRSITLHKRKVGPDIVIPMSAAIARELQRARNVAARDVELIFPGSRKWNDVPRHALRHSYRTVAADLQIDELTVRLLLGHALTGISQSYVTRAVLSGGVGLRAAQRKISRRILNLLSG